MIHTAVTTIQFQTVSFDCFRSSVARGADTTISHGEAPSIDDSQECDDAIASGTWYESAIESGGPIIDETYYQQESAESASVTSSDSSAARRSFKTPQTTVVTPPQRKMSAYSKLSEKLNDLTANLPPVKGLKEEKTQHSASVATSADSPPTEEVKVLVEPSPSLNLRKKALSELAKMSSSDSIDMEDSGGREAYSEPPRRVVSCSGLDRPDIERLVEYYSRPLICNHHLLREGTQMIIDLFQKWNEEEASRNKSSSITHTSDVLCESTFECPLEVNRLDLIESLMRKQSIFEVCDGLTQALELCNLEMSKRWSLVLSALPKVMKEIVETLRGKYVHGMRAFWKGQTLLFQCR
jgi:hypothetical protein